MSSVPHPTEDYLIILSGGTVTPNFLKKAKLAKFAELTFHALALIEDKTTVLLPDNKHRGTQVSCSTL